MINPSNWIYLMSFPRKLMRYQGILFMTSPHIDPIKTIKMRRWRRENNRSEEEEEGEEEEGK